MTKTNSDNARSLVQAAGVGDLAAVRRLLSQGADINAYSPDSGFRPLIAAACEDQTHILKYLVNEGVNLEGTVTSKYPVNFMRQTALSVACRNGHEKSVAFLIKAGADVNAGMASNELWTPLKNAAVQGHVKIVRMLLSSGAIPTSTALANAIAKGHVEIVSILLKAGLGDPRFRISRDAVLIAVPVRQQDVECRLKIIEALLDASAEIDGSDLAGQTALMVASRRDFIEIVELLLKRGADVTKADGAGFTALHQAAASASAGMVLALLRAGSDPLRPTITGDTPLTLAKENDHREVLDVLSTAASATRAGHGVESKATKKRPNSNKTGEAQVKSGNGSTFKFKSKRHPSSKGKAYGLQPILEHLSNDSCSVALFAAKAPLKSVSKAVAKAVQVRKLFPSVTITKKDQGVTLPTLVALVAIRNSDWVIVYRSVGWIKLEYFLSVPQLAERISESLNCEVITFCADDTKGLYLGYDWFQNGKPEESIYCQVDGTIDRFESTSRKRPRRNITAKFFDRTFKDWGVIAPVCYPRFAEKALLYVPEPFSNDISAVQILDLESDD